MDDGWRHCILVVLLYEMFHADSLLHRCCLLLSLLLPCALQWTLSVRGEAGAFVDTTDTSESACAAISCLSCSA